MAIVNFNSISGVSTISATSSITVGDKFISSAGVGIGTTTTAGRNAGVGTAIGTLIYNTTTGAVEGYGPQGWVAIKTLESFTATGGTKILSGNYAFHVFSYPNASNFVVTNGSTNVELLIVGGGGASNVDDGGGGGAGGICYGASVPFTPGTYTVTVGAGGIFNSDRNNATNTWGGESSITHPVGTIIAYGGQGASNAGGAPTYTILTPWGGSSATYFGSGAGGRVTIPATNEAFVQPIANAQPGRPTFGGLISNYGNIGGTASNAYVWNAGGGGGAGGAGQPSAPGASKNGGVGQAFPSFPGPVISPGLPSPQRSAFESAVGPTGLFGGGGAGAVESPSVYTGLGGPGGGGNAGTPMGSSGVMGTGGGQGTCGGGTPAPVPDSGGSGIVIIKYSTL